MMKYQIKPPPKRDSNFSMPLNAHRNSFRPVNEISPLPKTNQSKISVKGYKRSFANMFSNNLNSQNDSTVHNFVGEKPTNIVSREVAVSQRFMDYKRNEIKTRSFTLENEVRKINNKT